MIDTNLEQDIRNIVEGEGLELFDIEIVKEGKNSIFRIFIAKEKGEISIDDCVKVSEIVSPLLDVEEPLSVKYSLEVSSPGIERKLTKLRHYQLSIGKDVEVTDIEGNRYIGKLKEVRDDTILVEDKTIGDISISFENIVKGRTIFNF